MTTLGKALRQRLRKLSNSIPVDQLQKRGVKEVNVVGLDHIVALIEEAVRRSLRSKLMGLDREQVAGATREEFLRLLKNNETLERSRDEALKMKQRAEEEVDELRRQLTESHQRLREELEMAERDLRVRYEGEDAKIVTQINGIFRALTAEGTSTTADLRDRMVEMVLDMVGKERQETIQARQVAHDREIDLLERRINKLKGSLEQTEGRLANIASLKNVDPGISSIYKEVQGLEPADAHFERKKELMADIFQANFALQKGADSES